MKVRPKKQAAEMKQELRNLQPDRAKKKRGMKGQHLVIRLRNRRR